MIPMTLQNVVLAATEEATQSALGPAFADSFWVVIALGVAMFLLGYDLIRRLRRAKFRTEIHEELAAEIAERDAAAGSDPAAGFATDEGTAAGSADRSESTPPRGGSVTDSKE
jgi:hypothetical protein